jgi:formamidase
LTPANLKFQTHTASDDIKNVDLTKVHNLSGPVAVEGAEPGDCLVVDILDGACPSRFV